eukprot:TRINITY_DN5225_c0_g1_i1.p1 TRINITY_DN5225_c0_g1~~TRINITY_DN5225_c0_g1_i1.p1  ORF type:complete len:350 (+),score=81.15 TRINITY_DN5225_c0_g1_i1:577-1626(+)
MHGVGKDWVAKAFQAFDLPPYIPVPKQIEADPDFPTVAFPNPEEGKGALKLAFEEAEKHSASVVIANDPDSDRLAVAEKLESGEWKVFTGNETGILLARWIWEKERAAHPDFPVDKIAMLNTTVSSKMLKAMADKEGFRYEETLTGFKWLGNLAEQLSEQGYRVLLAFEEAIGFMVSDICLDKDGVRTAAILAECAGNLYRGKSTLNKYLESTYDKYGYFRTRNKYFFCYELEKMDAVFTALRNDGKYQKACGKYKVKNVRDLDKMYDDNQPGNKPVLPRSSRMITFFFENGAIATIRGSGTEPKLKYYVEHHGSDRENVTTELNDLVETIISDWLQPTKYGLEFPKED